MVLLLERPDRAECELLGDFVASAILDVALCGNRKDPSGRTGMMNGTRFDRLTGRTDGFVGQTDVKHDLVEPRSILDLHCLLKRPLTLGGVVRWRQDENLVCRVEADHAREPGAV